MPEQEQEQEDWRTRPIVTATLPLWDGRQIQAGKGRRQGRCCASAGQQARHEQTEITIGAGVFCQLFTQEVLTVQMCPMMVYEHLERAIVGMAFHQGAAFAGAVAVDNAERELRKAKMIWLGCKRL